MVEERRAGAREPYDLVIAGGRVIDPRNGQDGIADLAIEDGRIAAIGRDLSGAARQRVDAAGLLVVPGLIDLHTHIYHKATAYGVDPDPVARRSGVVTMVDAGSAGYGNFAGLRDFVFARSQFRALAYVNISYPGIFAFDRDYSFGEASVEDLLSVDHCVAAIENNRDVAVGVKVRLGPGTSGEIGLLALDRALQAAERTGLPIMTHIGKPPPSYGEIVARLRPGDVLTHCFRPAPNAPVDAAGAVLPALRAARQRGVLFDIGHGMGAFGFKSAEHAVADGFPPDIISSDVHALCIDGPAYDLLHTMSKLVACGLDLKAVIAMVTDRPARALQRDDRGHLTVGVPADITLLAEANRSFVFSDVRGEQREGRFLFESRGSFVGGVFRDADPRPFEEHA
ncbi:amidohydrolase/deacetylase family metallohydrolase [Pseudohoeflea coraliihabitans]|uniref:Amidohydrolase/deacetylase family metallohydrolase n=1 Tax=Pseudohoeflea coraliihabitans TaxID=2860393 RepID=A0ABS6WL01_9HYPH|nr:amidohydrolase/deacetylase family metallohydrolase [Pseudohoeflea sp. DP4N28-3]MBW3096626.1 amidohydrolase/deacetylase family metallohydrolase [Pseudohoeflea sp. DP4N28-3]